MALQELYIVTGNSNKFKECKNYLDHALPEFRVEQKPLDLPEPQTLDIEEVAMVKAKAAWDHFKKPVLIDDGGFFLEEFPSFPGALSKYVFKGLGLEGFMRIAPVGTKCFFETCIVYADGPDSLHLFKGKCKGTFVMRPDYKPNKEMPYRPLFQPDGSTKTLEELFGTPEFETYHHRVMALKKFVEWYKNRK